MTILVMSQQVCDVVELKVMLNTGQLESSSWNKSVFIFGGIINTQYCPLKERLLLKMTTKYKRKTKVQM